MGRIQRSDHRVIVDSRALEPLRHEAKYWQKLKFRTHPRKGSPRIILWHLITELRCSIRLRGSCNQWFHVSSSSQYPTAYFLFGCEKMIASGEMSITDIHFPVKLSMEVSGILINMSIVRDWSYQTTCENICPRKVIPTRTRKQS